MQTHALTDLVSNLEIARRLGVTPQTCWNWTKRHENYPAPLEIPGVSVPVWSWQEIKNWKESRKD